MKYIKLFEEQEIGKFWLVRTDEPYLTLSLKKIGFPMKGDWSWVKNAKKIYIAFDPLMGSNGRWFFDSYKEMNKRNLQFMGEITIPQYEIDALKYNI